MVPFGPKKALCFIVKEETASSNPSRREREDMTTTTTTSTGNANNNNNPFATIINVVDFDNKRHENNTLK